MGKLAEAVQAAQTDLTAAKEKLHAVAEALEAAPEEAALIDELEAATTGVENCTKRVSALEAAEKAIAARAEVVKPGNDNSSDPAAPAIIRRQGDRLLKKGGELMWKHATAKLVAHVTRADINEVLGTLYANDDRVKASYDFITKTAVAPATTYTAGWAAELVREDTRGFIETITEVSVAAALNARVQSFDFDGAGSIKIPVENPLAATPTEPAWVGEGGVIPLTAFSFGSTTLSPYKLAAISTMTREIIQRSTPSIEAVVQNLLRKAFSKVLDQALLTVTSAAIANVRPASLYNGVAPTAAAAGTPDENIRADVLALLAALQSAGLGTNPVLIGNKMNMLNAGMTVNAFGDFLYRDEINGGALLGIPLISSGNVPLNQLGIVDASYFAMALGAIEFDVSDVATVTEANADATAPTQADDGSGALGTAGAVPRNAGIPVSGDSGAAGAGYTARSLWQTYSVGIRMVSQLSWGKLNPAAAQYIPAVDWG